MTLAEQAEAYQYGAEQKVWLDLLDVEVDNVRAALAWSLDGGSVESGLRLVAAIREFWEHRGNMLEGLAWSKHLLAAGHEISPSIRVKALYRAGEFIFEERDIALSAEALNLARQIGDPLYIAWALCTYAYFPQTIRGFFDPSTIPLMDESLALFRQIDNPYGLSHALRRRAIMAGWEKNYAYGRILAEEALNRARAVGDKNSMGWSLWILAEILIRDGHDPNEIAAMHEESVALFRELGDRVGLRAPLAVLGRLEQLAGHATRAQSYYEEALVLLAETGYHLLDAYRYSLAGLGAILEAQGKREEAARLFAAAQWRDWFNLPFFSQATFDSHVAAIRTRLDEAKFAAAWAEGKAMTWKQAASYGLQQASYLREALPLTPISQQRFAEPLSARELEILHLIADGLSNGEIAEQLVLARTTIKWYVHQILDKLDATNRTQAVARARTLGLLT